MKKFEVPCYFIVDDAGKKVAAIVDIEDFETLLEGAGAFFQLAEMTEAANAKAGAEKPEKKVSKKSSVKKTEKVEKKAVKKSSSKKK